VVGDAKGYQSSLSNQIAVLSAKQQSILSQRLSSLNIPLTAYTSQGGCSSDLTNGKSPGFSGGFAFFTYGVPNRVGLNQYGAKGRAEAGQNAQQILSAYYNADYTTGYNTGINIHVTGTNEYGQSFDNNWSIEEYLKHVYEIPSNWPAESLKAQAIAARSYALASTNNGANSICPSQSCQVVKQEENSDAWKQAVSDTAGIVLTNGGQPIKAWFSSTHGGYIFSSSDIGWNGTAWTKNAKDTTGDVGSFGDLNSNAYDKASPWFYCDWGSRSQYGGTAWLKPEEVADIANVLMLVQRDGGTKEHLYQPDKPNPAGTDTWDSARVRSELSSRGGSPITSATNVSIGADFGSGRTTTVNINGNSFSGGDFKTYFNLRAPSNLQIVGPLFNVEKN
jgi:peptidoglycan hydrolase-like amidase